MCPVRNVTYVSGRSPEPRTRNGKNLRARDAPFIVTVGI
jgi:hypothetical protein